MQKPSLFQVLQPPKGIANLLRQDIEIDRVDREIPSFRRLPERHIRMDVDLEGTVPASSLVLNPRQADINRPAFQLIDAEGFPHP